MLNTMFQPTLNPRIVVLRNMMDVDIIPGMTPLALAAKSRDPESIIELVKLNLDRWAEVLSTCHTLGRFF